MNKDVENQIKSLGSIFKNREGDRDQDKPEEVSDRIPENPARYVKEKE